MSEKHDTTNSKDDASARSQSIETTAELKRRAREFTRKRVARSRRAHLIELTGCPFSDARGAGLWLEPRIGCGPAHLEGAKLVWDPSQPVRIQLRELAEQTAKWRDRRGLYLVGAVVTQKAHGDDSAAIAGQIAEPRTVVTPRRCRRQLRLLKGALQ